MDEQLIRNLSIKFILGHNTEKTETTIPCQLTKKIASNITQSDAIKDQHMHIEILGYYCYRHYIMGMCDTKFCKQEWWLQYMNKRIQYFTKFVVFIYGIF